MFGTVAGLGQNTGMAGIPPIAIGSLSLISSQSIYYLIWFIVGLAMLASANLLNSREGRAIRSLRGGNVLLASLGVDIFRIRQLTNGVFVRANHRRHSASCRTTSFVHKTATLLHEFETVFEIERSGRRVRGQFA